MLCCKTWKVLGIEDVGSWDEWMAFVNDNYRYIKENSTPFDWIGHITKWTLLPSYHPYWRYHNEYLDRKAKHIRFKIILKDLKNKPKQTDNSIYSYGKPIDIAASHALGQPCTLEYAIEVMENSIKGTHMEMMKFYDKWKPFKRK